MMLMPVAWSICRLEPTALQCQRGCPMCRAGVPLEQVAGAVARHGGQSRAVIPQLWDDTNNANVHGVLRQVRSVRRVNGVGRPLPAAGVAEPRMWPLVFAMGMVSHSSATALSVALSVALRASGRRCVAAGARGERVDAGRSCRCGRRSLRRARHGRRGRRRRWCVPKGGRSAGRRSRQPRRPRGVLPRSCSDSDLVGRDGGCARQHCPRVRQGLQRLWAREEGCESADKGHFAYQHASLEPARAPLRSLPSTLDIREPFESSPPDQQARASTCTACSVSGWAPRPSRPPHS